MKIKTRKSAFTLIELLVVIAIIGILAGIIFPSVSAVVERANAAKTRTMFSQWIAAIEDFRSEYGFYPNFDGSEIVDGERKLDLSSQERATHFINVLTGQEEDAADSRVNRRNIRFYSFDSDSLYRGEDGTGVVQGVQDSFGNVNIEIIMDADRDGMLSQSAFHPSMHGDGPREVPSEGLNAGVAIYSIPDEAMGFPKVTTWN